MQMSKFHKKIIETRDPKYDGQFYFGVKTTKIYCRPTCPARPKPENILIFNSSASAEEHGYRACKRCKPNYLSGVRKLPEEDNIINLALNLIDSELTTINIKILCEKLDLSDRHLRRVFNSRMGTSPQNHISHQRISLAKTLLVGSKNTITQIAFGSGFNSIRMFNTAFKKQVGVSPSLFRKDQKLDGILKNSIKMFYQIHPPYDWIYTLKFLKRHATFGLEVVENSLYTRYYPKNTKEYSMVEVSMKNKNTMQFNFINCEVEKISSYVHNLKRLFDVDHNPAHLENANTTQKSIRIPGGYNFLESTIGIILGQLISVEQAEAIFKKFVLMFGRKVKTNSDLEIYHFPSPKKIINANLLEIGMTKTKAHAIKEVARFYSKYKCDLNNWSKTEELMDHLSSIKGIGPWTTNLIRMRLFSQSDAMPKNDLFIQRALDKKIIKLEDWVGFEPYLTHILWRDHAQELKKK
ncbi:MAG: DNA-3-methyladenine glycosylase 2 family protein [Bdellovibrionales bacterium]